MKKNIKNRTPLIIIISLVFLLIIGLYMFPNPPNNTHQLKTFKQLSSNTLIDEYESQGYENFIEKALEIHGVLKKIHFKNNVYTLYLSHESSESFVLCELQADQNIKVSHLVIGEKLIVKGILKGKLLDIILLNCIII